MKELQRSRAPGNSLKMEYVKKKKKILSEGSNTFQVCIKIRSSETSN